ncbi:WcaI family glycosyltransferase [Hymenobacter cavernae]|uniref:Colanic acid biosynthesis glycosyltransferase WcaI n=1 Tax=Hymenobacter cavernae TaxID=2044852 RepID=A0ABQ1UFK1_9BACT|nr:WcaI family glycosyltransferase [Hymenobacter cavernae]GGF17709.1 colanic acid biosynthesis glycosyltransferase WcaI [Hymenobacter cavernae]
MKKRILLIGYNFYPEPTGIGKYSGEMIQWLAEKGYDCTVITTYPYYPYWKVQEPYHKNRFGYTTERKGFSSGGSITLYRCPMYVPAKPSGVKRILLDLSFLLSAFFKLLQLLPAKKFDFVVTVVPSFQFGILGILYKKFKNAKLFYHIQDMQIEAARDLQMIKSEKVINALLSFEKYIFDKADYVSSISEGMVARIQEKAKKDIFLLPNWADVNLFYPITDKASVKCDFGFAPTDKIVLYSGAIGEKQGLEAILYAAKEFQNQQEVKFIICGSGPYKEKLQNLASELGLQNVIFFPLQPHEKFNQFLNLADIHLVIQKATASDLVMPSKLTTILSVGGLALITANPGSGLHTLVQKYNMGLLVEAENQQALNEGLRRALAADTTEQRKNARAYAERYLAIDKIMESFEELVQHA